MEDRHRYCAAWYPSSTCRSGPSTRNRTALQRTARPAAECVAEGQRRGPVPMGEGPIWRGSAAFQAPPGVPRFCAARGPPARRPAGPARPRPACPDRCAARLSRRSGRGARAGCRHPCCCLTTAMRSPRDKTRRPPSAGPVTGWAGHRRYGPPAHMSIARASAPGLAPFGTNVPRTTHPRPVD